MLSPFGAITKLEPLLQVLNARDLIEVRSCRRQFSSHRERSRCPAVSGLCSGRGGFASKGTAMETTSLGFAIPVPSCRANTICFCAGDSVLGQSHQGELLRHFSILARLNVLGCAPAFLAFSRPQGSQILVGPPDAAGKGAPAPRPESEIIAGSPPATSVAWIYVGRRDGNPIAARVGRSHQEALEPVGKAKPGGSHWTRRSRSPIPPRPCSS
jgi:hypothetical protein